MVPWQDKEVRVCIQVYRVKCHMCLVKNLPSVQPPKPVVGFYDLDHTLSIYGLEWNVRTCWDYAITFYTGVSLKDALKC